MKAWLYNLNEKAVQFSIFELVVSIFLAVAFSLIIRWFYIRFGKGNSNRKILADSFILLAASVTIIMFMIKASIALSLGLVGALSIVRFRAAIKEPEELVYLLFTIAVGLGFGSGQHLTTIVAFIFVLVCLYIINRLSFNRLLEQNVFITLRSSNINPEVAANWNSVISKHVKKKSLRRFDKNSEQVCATYLVESVKDEHLSQLNDEIVAHDDQTEIIIIDNSKPVIHA